MIFHYWDISITIIHFLLSKYHPLKLVTVSWIILSKEEVCKLEEASLLNYSKKHSSCLMTWSVLKRKVTFYIWMMLTFTWQLLFLCFRTEIFEIKFTEVQGRNLFLIYVCKSSSAFLLDHWKDINYFLGNIVLPKKTLKRAEIHQPNMEKCEHLFGSEMKQWAIFCGIHLCQVASYLVEGSNLKLYQRFFKHRMIYYSSVKSSRTENCSIKVNVNSASEFKRNRLAVSIPNKI